MYMYLCLIHPAPFGTFFQPKILIHTSLISALKHMLVVLIRSTSLVLQMRTHNMFLCRFICIWVLLLSGAIDFSDTVECYLFFFSEVTKLLTLLLLNPDILCLCKQCRSRSVGFCLPVSILICINKLDQVI